MLASGQVNMTQEIKIESKLGSHTAGDHNARIQTELDMQLEATKSYKNRSTQEHPP